MYMFHESIAGEISIESNVIGVHLCVRLGSLRELVSSLPMANTLGQNQITKTYNLVHSSYSSHNKKETFHVFVVVISNIQNRLECRYTSVGQPDYTY